MRIEEVKQLLEKDKETVTDLNSLNELKVKYLGKKGMITELNQEIKNIPNEEKKELLIKIKNGDKEARTKFIQGNLRLVLSVIQRFYGRGEKADDLFQVGCIGLIKAIDNFDINQDVQFSTYRSSYDNAEKLKDT